VQTAGHEKAIARQDSRGQPVCDWFEKWNPAPGEGSHLAKFEQSLGRANQFAQPRAQARGPAVLDVKIQMFGSKPVDGAKGAVLDGLARGGGEAFVQRWWQPIAPGGLDVPADRLLNQAAHRCTAFRRLSHLSAPYSMEYRRSTHSRPAKPIRRRSSGSR